MLFDYKYYIIREVEIMKKELKKPVTKTDKKVVLYYGEPCNINNYSGCMCKN